MSVLRGLGFAGVAIAVLGIAGVVVSMHRQHYQGPPRTAEPVGDLGRSSSLVLPVVASLDALQAQLNAQAPTDLYAIDESRSSCISAQTAQVCVMPRPRSFGGGCMKWATTTLSPAVDCRITGKVTRGTFAIVGDGDTLRLSMPVQATVTARTTGGQVRDTADSAISAVTSMKADIDDSWQPTAVVDADYSGTDKFGVTILGQRMDFTPKVDPKVREQFEALQAKAPELLAHLDVKGKAEDAWAKAFATVHLGTSPDTWLRFTPETIGYQSYRITGRELQFSVLLGGKAETFLGKQPAPAKATPLPKLQRTLPDPGFAFTMPVAIDYDVFRGQGRRTLKLGQAQMLDLPNIGKVRTTVTGLSIYQTTGGKLAVGVTFDATPSTDILRTRGIVWLIASLEQDNSGKRVRVGDLQVYSQSDNEPIDLLVNIAQSDPINHEIRSALVYDFTPDYDDALKQGNDALNQKLPNGLALAGKLDDLSVDRIVAGPDALMVLLAAKGSASLRFGAQ